MFASSLLLNDRRCLNLFFFKFNLISLYLAASPRREKIPYKNWIVIYGGDLENSKLIETLRRNSIRLIVRKRKPRERENS